MLEPRRPVKESSLKLSISGYGDFTYSELYAIRGKSFRTGSWRRLRQVEKAFFNASLALAKLRGR